MNFDEMVKTEPEATPRRGLERRRQPLIVVGGLPTVSLLPRELRDAEHTKSVRRALVGVVVLAAIVSGGATAGAALLSSASQERLTAAGTEAQTLAGQLRKFQDVQQLQGRIAAARAAVKVGSSTEIDWQAQFQAIEADMPSGYTVTSVVADSANVIEDYPQGTSPLDKPRAATVQMAVNASDITQLPIWLRKLRSIKSYADASVAVTSGDGTGYNVALTIHLSPKALITQPKAAQ